MPTRTGQRQAKCPCNNALNPGSPRRPAGGRTAENLPHRRDRTRRGCEKRPGDNKHLGQRCRDKVQKPIESACHPTKCHVLFSRMCQRVGQCRRHAANEYPGQPGNDIPENRTNETGTAPDREYLYRSAGKSVLVDIISLILNNTARNIAGALHALAGQGPLEPDAHCDKDSFNYPSIHPRASGRNRRHIIQR